jgi:putative transposase
VRYWWNRFGPMFANEIRKKRIHPPHSYSISKWHLDEVFGKINGETHYLWRAIDHEGKVLEAFISKRPDRKAALIFFKKIIK